jgi:hypothetical protein
MIGAVTSRECIAGLDRLYAMYCGNRIDIEPYVAALS